MRSLNEVIIGPPEKVSRLEDSQLSGVSANGQPFHRQQQELESAYLTEMDALPDAEDNLYWVTVFGFASNQLQQILELFSKHGDIMAHKVSIHRRGVPVPAVGTNENLPKKARQRKTPK